MEWYPWYPDDYLQDTYRLSLEADATYRRLIDHYMRTEKPLPSDQWALRRIIGWDEYAPYEWSAIWKEIEGYFKTSSCEQFLIIPRCEKELDIQARRRKSYSKRAKHAAEVRWKINGVDANSMPEASLEDAKAMLNDATETETETETEIDPPIIPPQRRGAGNGRRQETSLLTWQPDEADYQYAEEHGLDPSRILQDVRDWAANAKPAGKANKRDPRRFWQTWCRREADRNAAGRAGFGGVSRGGPSSFVGAIARAARRGNP